MNYFSRIKPEFCSSCKASLFARDKLEGYDAVTGDSLIIKQLVCPKKRWWKLTDHDLWEYLDWQWEKSIW